MEISEKLLEILCCPVCKGDLELTETKDGLICSPCELKYPIRDEITIMVREEAVPVKGGG